METGHDSMPKEAQSLLSPEEKEEMDDSLEELISGIEQSLYDRINRQADWLLLITGGTFVALLSSGLKPPLFWEEKLSVFLLLLSSSVSVFRLVQETP